MPPISPTALPLPIPNLPVSSIHIVYDFITPSEEEYLIQVRLALPNGCAFMCVVLFRIGDPRLMAFRTFTCMLSVYWWKQRVDDWGGDGRDRLTPTAEGEGQGRTKPMTRWGWTTLNGRRSMCWGGSLTKQGYLIPLPFPNIMTSQYPKVIPRMQECANKLGWEEELNHCLVNEYLPGQGILPHTDGPAYAPLVTTLSLGSHTVLRFKRSSSTITPVNEEHASQSQSKVKELTPVSTPKHVEPTQGGEEETFSLFLPARSLILIQDQVYEDWLHSIDATKEDQMHELMRCKNWGMWWERKGDILLTRREDSKEEGQGRGKQELGQEENDELVKRRKFVESGKGWDRSRRISLTCRIVKKVVKGFKMGGGG
ncbi:BQ2448_7184 [Microbotryum intermedium]|uniref:BQ2448_7184 protein n=1 Tax=Microbotryum intermedium TaxID=269621 RepID=A0A238FKD4_9BASI|nr:BQ2448_7184 [Microbotryum intermedium]